MKARPGTSPKAEVEIIDISNDAGGILSRVLDFQPFVARCMGASTVEVASGHVAMLSNPELVIDVICAALQKP